MIEELLTVALSFPHWVGDLGETKESLTELYRPVIQAIDETGRNRWEKIVLLAQFIEETHGARLVLEGRCHEMPEGQRCDNGKAVGPWQVHTAWCPATTLQEQARCALRAARAGRDRCRDHSLSPAHGAFSGLAGRSCGWPGADRRVATARRIERALVSH